MSFFKVCALVNVVFFAQVEDPCQFRQFHAKTLKLDGQWSHLVDFTTSGWSQPPHSSLR